MSRSAVVSPVDGYRLLWSIAKIASRKDAKMQKGVGLDIEAVATVAVDCGFKLHSQLGPGLLESAYEALMAHSLAKRGLAVERERPVPIHHDGVAVDESFRLGLLLEEKGPHSSLPFFFAPLRLRVRQSFWPLVRTLTSISLTPMLAMHPDCERCGADLPAQDPGAFICSFECTFCAPCAEALDDRCPNCGGELVDRPTRTGAALKRAPGASERRFGS